MKKKITNENLKPFMKTELMPFQLGGVRFLHKARGNALIADDMGLGKTIQLLTFIAMHKYTRPAVVACPAAVKFVWESQIAEHTYMDCIAVSGEKPDVNIMEYGHDVVIINYDILPMWQSVLFPSLFGMDEIHYCKNMTTARSKACLKVAKRAKYVIGLSGTPIENKPVEIYPALKMIAPDQFHNKLKFSERYGDPSWNHWKKRNEYKGSSNAGELKELLKPLVIRRMKSEVLTQLPKKQRNALSVDITNREEYDYATNDFMGWYEDKYGYARAKKIGTNAMVQAGVKLGQLRMIAGEGKVAPVIDWIKEFTSSGKKLVVFCYHIKSFDSLMKAFPKAAIGGGRKKQKDEVHKFQNDPKCTLYIGSIKSDGTGITLTASDTVLFLEIGWTPGTHDQAEDRVHRIGQESQSVHIYYMLVRDSVEEKIWDLLGKKREIITKIFDADAYDCTPIDINSIFEETK